MIEWYPFRIVRLCRISERFIRQLTSICFSFRNFRNIKIILIKKTYSKWTVRKGESGRSRESGRSWAKLDGHLSQIGRSWVKVDVHSTTRSLGINQSVEVDGPKGWKWTVLKMNGRANLDGPSKSRRSWVKLDGHSSQSGRSMTIVNGLLSQSGRSWVKVDGHWTKSEWSLGINRSVEVDGSGPLSQTVHFKSFGPSSLIHDRPVSVVWTVHFDPRPFTLDLTHQNDRYIVPKSPLFFVF